MEITSIPAYVRDLANSIAVTGYMSTGELNRRLETLGWDDIEIDEYTLELVTAMFEPDIQYNPPSWFLNTFAHYGIDDFIDGEH